MQKAFCRGKNEWLKTQNFVLESVENIVGIGEKADYHAAFSPFHAVF